MLEKELSKHRLKKNSGNSSISPSQDPHRIRRTESLIKSVSWRNLGGQPGREGSFLKSVSEPDETVLHQPCFCTSCGNDLSDAVPEFLGKRQVIYIPLAVPAVTEHRIYGKLCGCGHLTASDYPSEVRGSVCYGSNMQALTAYFHARQYIPYERMREMYRDIFGLSGFGWNCSILRREIQGRLRNYPSARSPIRGRRR